MSQVAMSMNNINNKIFSENDSTAKVKNWNLHSNHLKGAKGKLRMVQPVDIFWGGDNYIHHYRYKQGILAG